MDAFANALDCLEIDARGFEIEATLARAFWPDTLPDRSDRERDLAGIVEGYERGGIDDIRARLMAEAVRRSWTARSETAARCAGRWPAPRSTS